MDHKIIIGLLVVVLIILLIISHSQRKIRDSQNLATAQLRVIKSRIDTLNDLAKDAMTTKKSDENYEQLQEDYGIFDCDPPYVCDTKKSYTQIARACAPIKSKDCAIQKFKEQTLPTIKSKLPWSTMKKYGFLAITEIPGAKGKVCSYLGKGRDGIVDLKRWVQSNIDTIFDKIRSKFNFLDNIGVPSSVIDFVIDFVKKQVDEPLAGVIEKYLLENVKALYTNKSLGCPPLPEPTLNQIQQDLKQAVANDPDLVGLPD